MDKPFPVKLEIEAIERNLPFYKNWVSEFNRKTPDNDIFAVKNFITGAEQTLSELKATTEYEIALLNDAVPKLKNALDGLKGTLASLTSSEITQVKIKTYVPITTKPVVIVKVKQQPKALSTVDPQLKKALEVSRKLFGTKPGRPGALETVKTQGFTDEDFKGAPDVGPGSRGPLT